MKRVYVAASSADTDRARRCMASLSELGLEVSYDWSADAVRFPRGETPPSAGAQHARLALDGVVAADVVLVLLSSDRAFPGDPPAEMGAALMIGRPVVLAGAARNRSRLGPLCAVFAKSDADGIDAVLKLVGMARPEARSA